MSEKPSVVYMEDLVEAKVVQPAASNPPSSPPSSSPVDASSSGTGSLAEPKKVTEVIRAATGSLKRQRTLADMFKGSPSAASSGGTAKKQRLSADPASSRKSVVSSAASAGTEGGAAASPSLNSIPFSLTAFQEGMTDEERKLLRLECETMGKSWLKVLKDEVKKPYFLALKRFLLAEGVTGPEAAPGLKVYPAPKDIYSWSKTPLGRLKVVLIGQDPYHGPRQAHGLCFSVPAGVAAPPSLRNIYSELKNEYPDFIPPAHGNLTAWAENGVLMLNTCLTVRAGEAGSHSNKGWEQFTDKVVDIVDKYGGANLSSDGGNRAGLGRGVVFLAWGAWATKRVAKLDKTKHLILTSAHPSPFSAHRGFLGNGHFKAANDWLENKYGADGCVNWCNL